MRACLREQKSYGLRFSWFPMHLVCRVVEFSLYSQRAVTVSTITSLVLVWGLSGAVMLSRFNNLRATSNDISSWTPPHDGVKLHCIYVSVRYALPNMLCRFTTCYNDCRFTTCLLFVFHRRMGTVLLLSHTVWGELAFHTLSFTGRAKYEGVRFVTPREC